MTTHQASSMLWPACTVGSIEQRMRSCDLIRDCPRHLVRREQATAALNSDGFGEGARARCALTSWIKFVSITSPVCDCSYLAANNITEYQASNAFLPSPDEMATILMGQPSMEQFATKSYPSLNVSSGHRSCSMSRLSCSLSWRLSILACPTTEN